MAFAWIARTQDPALPFSAACALAAASFTFTLPFEPGWRWAGSRTLAWTVTIALLTFVETAALARASLLAAPGIWTVGALGWTFANLAAAFAPSRRRARANIPYTSQFSAYFSTPAERQRERQKVAHQDFRRVTWKPSGSRGTVRWWLRALAHERRSEWSGLNHPFVLLVVAVLALALLSGRSSDPAQNLFDYAVGQHRSAVTHLPILIVVSLMLTVVPRAEGFYVLSRDDRTRIVFASSLAQLARSYLLPFGALLIAGLAAAAWLGQRFEWHGYVKLLVIAAWVVPFAPLVVWGRLHREITNSRLSLLLTLAATMTATMVLARLLYDTLPFADPAGFGPQLGVWLIVSAMSHAFFFAALRRFHRQGDLIQRGSVAEEKFGLV